MDESTKRAEEQWKAEKAMPLWRVVLSGDEVEWVARPGVNENKDGVPQPWTAPARAEVLVRAVSGDYASAKALMDNQDYHTVESVKKVEE